MRVSTKSYIYMFTLLTEAGKYNVRRQKYPTKYSPYLHRYFTYARIDSRSFISTFPLTTPWHTILAVGMESHRLASHRIYEPSAVYSAPPPNKEPALWQPNM